MQIKLVRHAESEANARIVNAQVIGDHNVSLTDKGKDDSFHKGISIASFLSSALRYCSPYKRTRQTFEWLIEGALSVGTVLKGLPWYEDPRLREVEWGLGIDDPNYWQKIEAMKEQYGSFWVRRPNGESSADCYDRCAAFIGTMMRQIDRKSASKVLIVSHGLTVRCFAASFMHLTVEQFESLRNPHNLDVITISNEGIKEPQFRCGSWEIEGLRQESI